MNFYLIKPLVYLGRTKTIVVSSFQSSSPSHFLERQHSTSLMIQQIVSYVFARNKEKEENCSIADICTKYIPSLYSIWMKRESHVSLS